MYNMQWYLDTVCTGQLIIIYYYTHRLAMITLCYYLHVHSIYNVMYSLLHMYMYVIMYIHVCTCTCMYICTVYMYMYVCLFD